MSKVGYSSLFRSTWGFTHHALLFDWLIGLLPFNPHLPTLGTVNNQARHTAKNFARPHADVLNTVPKTSASLWHGLHTTDRGNWWCFFVHCSLATKTWHRIPQDTTLPSYKPINDLRRSGSEWQPPQGSRVPPSTIAWFHSRVPCF